MTNIIFDLALKLSFILPIDLTMKLLMNPKIYNYRWIYRQNYKNQIINKFINNLKKINY